MEGTDLISWMAWTPPTAIFFVVIGLMLAGMTFWGVVSPTVPRRGVLPLVTTRGDRLFIGLLASAYIHLAWLGLLTAPLYIATILCVILIGVLLRWG